MAARGMIRRGASLALNRLLDQPWARDRLRPFARRGVTFRLAPLPDWRLVIRDDGLVETPSAAENGEDAPTTTDAPAADTADLTVTLRPAALPQLLRLDGNGLRTLLLEADLAGPADLADAVQSLFRDLAWDIEEDLSRLVGDVAAHRMAGAGRALVEWQREAGLRLAQNFAEYWTEEQPVIARRDESQEFGMSVSALEEDVKRLAQRVERLHESIARRRA